jgi:hypothetical protein
MRRRTFFSLLAVLAAPGALRARRDAASTGETGFRLTVPLLAADVTAPAGRAYRMGWFTVAPQPSVQSLLDTFPVAASSSDAVWVQREVPWSRILAGTPMDTVLDEDWDAFIAFCRGLGLRVSILVDPLDGLDRTRESNETRAAGRTLNEPELRALHEQWVELVAARYQPDYLGLASEINSLAARGDPVLYGNIRDMCNRLALAVRAVAPETKVFVSFQVDEAWGRPPIPPSDLDHFALTREFDVDVFGLSSYPSFFFESPTDIPDDYFRRMHVAAGKPVILFEGGWSSDPLGQGESPATLAAQAAYVQRLFELLDLVEAELAILLLFADMDLDAYAAAAPGLNVDGLKAFSKMALVRSDLSPKPAFEVWKQRFSMPYVEP